MDALLFIIVVRAASVWARLDAISFVASTEILTATTPQTVVVMASHY